MRHGSLFSGIGGFDLAAEWMGWENIFHCENNPFCQQVLKYYWPNAESYGDIKETDFTKWNGSIDVLSGGFPCQPYSQAGKRKGKEDDRHLWPEMLRAIKEIQPGWVVGENVYGIINWSGGLVFDEVQTDLEVSGYEVWPYVLPACAVNAPHRRDRTWFISRLISDTCRNGGKLATEFKEGCHIIGNRLPLNESNTFYGAGVTANTKIQRERSGQKGEDDESGIKQLEIADPGSDSNNNDESGFIADAEQQGRKGADILKGTERLKQGAWHNWPTVEPSIRGRNDGFSGRLAGITVPKKRGGFRVLNEKQTYGRHRNESIKGYGNAVVPQMVYQIYKAIEQYETKSKNRQ